MNRTPLSARLAFCAFLACAPRLARAAEPTYLDHFMMKPDKAHASVDVAVQRAAENLELLSQAKHPVFALTLAYANDEFAFSSIGVAVAPDGKKMIINDPSVKEMTDDVRFKKEYWADVYKVLLAERRTADAAGDPSGGATDALDGLGTKIKEQQRKTRDLALAKAVVDDIAKDETLVKALEAGAKDRETDDALLARKKAIYGALAQFASDKIDKDSVKRIAKPLNGSWNDPPGVVNNNNSSNNNDSGSYSNNNSSYGRNCEGNNGAKPRCDDR